MRYLSTAVICLFASCYGAAMKVTPASTFQKDCQGTARAVQSEIGKDAEQKEQVRLFLKRMIPKEREHDAESDWCDRLQSFLVNAAHDPDIPRRRAALGAICDHFPTSPTCRAALSSLLEEVPDAVVQGALPADNLSAYYDGGLVLFFVDTLDKQLKEQGFPRIVTAKRGVPDSSMPFEKYAKKFEFSLWVIAFNRYHNGVAGVDESGVGEEDYLSDTSVVFAGDLDGRERETAFILATPRAKLER